MKKAPIDPRGINEVSEDVVRQSREPEDIDLAAEATDSAPAKTLAREGKSKGARSKAAKSPTSSRKV